MKFFTNIIMNLKTPYEDFSDYIQKKTAYTLYFLAIITVYYAVDIVMSQLIYGFNYDVYLKLGILFLIVSIILLLIKKGEVASALNLFLLAGIIRSLFLIVRPFTLHFFLQIALIVFTIGAVHIKKYQLYLSCFICYILLVFSAYMPQNLRLYNSSVSLFAFRNTVIIGSFMYILCIVYLSKLIDKEIIKSKQLNWTRRTDSLTNLRNRFAFNETFENLPKNQTLAFLMLDLDNFKNINDQFGHHQGDIVLKEFSNLLKSFSSHDTHPFRMGGEEFSLLISNCTKDEMISIAKDINAMCQSNKYSNNLKVTVSIGCHFIKENWSKDCLIQYYREADESLYLAKSRGRNQFCVSNST